jgi:hypothetical protein
MPLDAYSHCPGGTGKKIKFCCPDFVAELEKIDRMVDGEQYLACLKHIDRLMEQEPDRNRACLMAIKCRLLRATDQRKAARATAASFLSKHPNNQVALAELAGFAAENDAPAALKLLERAIRAANGTLAGRTYEVMGLTAAALLDSGYPLAARAILELQNSLVEEDDRPAELLLAISQANDIPLLLRSDATMTVCPESVPWKDRYDAAVDVAGLGDWETVIERLAALAAAVPDSPLIWRSLALFRGWVADNAGCIEALRKYAVLRAAEDGGLDDAVESEAKAMFLCDDPLGDQMNIFKLVWTVKDVERAQESLSSSPRFRPVSIDLSYFSDGETPPPKGAYLLLDRPMPETAEGLTVETAPRMLGRALLFGKQTDRDAQFEVMDVAGDELSTVIAMVREATGEAVNPQAKQEVVDHQSASQRLLRTAFPPLPGASAEQLRPLIEQHRREALLDRWPNVKLKVLDGRSPREAADDPTYRVRLMAVMSVMEYWAGSAAERGEIDELRARLGLPMPGPIDPQEQPVGAIPTARLLRLSVDKLSDKDLIDCYYHAGAFAVRLAMRRFAEEIVNRSSLMDSSDRLHAYATLARTEEDPARALEYVEKGRCATEAKKRPSGSWDLIELAIHFARRNSREVSRVIEHIEKHHINEPGVAQALTQLLISVGILRPDGTPAFAPPPAMAAAEEAPEEQSKLWTPESAQSGGGKLWTPE